MACGCDEGEQQGNSIVVSHRRALEFQKAAVGVRVTYEWLRSHPAGCLFSLGSFDVGAVYSLQCNRIGDPGAKELAAAMKVNSSVTQLK